VGIQLNHKHQYSNEFIQKIYDDYYFYIKLLRILEKNHPKKDIKIKRQVKHTLIDLENTFNICIKGII
jgi:predicted component of viral defense system (DUF524 family)